MHLGHEHICSAAYSHHFRIVPNGGWSSEPYINQNIKRIEKISWRHDETRVLYYGERDYDPTGSKMVRNLERDLKKWDIGFEHVAITKEQIVQYGLENLTDPDPKVMAKLRRDSNANFFRSQNDGKLFLRQMQWDLSYFGYCGDSGLK